MPTVEEEKDPEPITAAEMAHGTLTRRQKMGIGLGLVGVFVVLGLVFFGVRWFRWQGYESRYESVTPKGPGALFRVSGTLRSGLNAPWLPFTGTLQIKQGGAMFERLNSQMGVFPLSDLTYYADGQGGREVSLMGFLPVLNTGDRAAQNVAWAQSVLFQCLTGHPPPAIVKDPWGKSRKVTVKFDLVGDLSEASMAAMDPFGQNKKSSWLVLKTIRFPAHGTKRKLSDAYVLGWRGLPQNFLPYEDLEKPGEDGMVEVQRFQMLGAPPQ